MGNLLRSHASRSCDTSRLTAQSRTFSSDTVGPSRLMRTNSGCTAPNQCTPLSSRNNADGVRQSLQGENLMLVEETDGNTETVTGFFEDPGHYVWRLGREHPLLITVCVLLAVAILVFNARNDTHIAGVDIRLPLSTAHGDGRSEMKALQGEIQYLWGAAAQSSGKLQVTFLSTPGVHVQITRDISAKDNLLNLLEMLHGQYSEKKTIRTAALQTSMRDFFDVVDAIQSEFNVSVADVDAQTEALHDIRPGAFPVMDSSLFVDPLYGVYRAGCSALRADIVQTPDTDSDIVGKKLELLAEFTVVYQRWRDRFLADNWGQKVPPLVGTVNLQRITLLEQFRLPAMQGIFLGLISGLLLAFVWRKTKPLTDAA